MLIVKKLLEGSVFRILTRKVTHENQEQRHASNRLNFIEGSN